MQTDTFVLISLTLQCQKYPQGICIKLEKHVFPYWKFKENEQLKKNLIVSEIVKEGALWAF